MNLISYLQTPFRIQLCFEKIIENLERTAADPIGEGSVRARALLREIGPYPELRNGITDISQIEEHPALISRLFADYFPPALAMNEIKAVNIPFANIIFNHTQRFKNILLEAGPAFEINIRDFDEHQFYVMNCCIILNQHYGTRLDFSKPMFYDIPTADGIIKHYRILYNGDFLEILPTEKSVPLSKEDIDLLTNNYDDVELWKEKFPHESWILKGFAIITLFDSTVENAVSIFKEKLLGLNVEGFQESIESIFRSIYRIPDIQIGFTVFSHDESKFRVAPFGQQIRSFILPDDHYMDARELLCEDAYHSLVEKKVYFTVADTDEFNAANPGSHLANRFLAQKVKSFILAPITRDGLLLGLLEVIAFRPKELNSINANKLDVVMSFLKESIQRLFAEYQNMIQAVIQDKFTTIHASVYWKFREEARRYIYNIQAKNEDPLQEIVFPDVYPLYGQVDIRGSSEARNTSVQRDLQNQLRSLAVLLKTVDKSDGFPHPALTIQHEVSNYIFELSLPVKAGTEEHVNNYLDISVHPLLRQVKQPQLLSIISKYFAETDKKSGSFHMFRRKYETTIAKINEKMSMILDNRQEEAQALFPHYYERFKTDGVEHNLYIGPSISPANNFDIQKLYDLRFWQLRVLCEMDIAHFRLMPSLPYALGVTSLILVYHSPIAIRFRMDEKRFDVEGSYNARFEIVKKRIDKAHSKDTNERIAQPGKITIVYSNEVEEQEYRGYIRILQRDNILEDSLEIIEVEDLRGVSGLKALRVKINHQ